MTNINYKPKIRCNDNFKWIFKENVTPCMILNQLKQTFSFRLKIETALIILRPTGAFYKWPKLA